VPNSRTRPYIFGSLIHNPQEVARLDALGKHIVTSLDDVKGNQVIITAPTAWTSKRSRR